MDALTRFVVPSSWRTGYTRLSRSVPYCADYRTIALATALVTRMIDPALSGDADGKTWSHEALAWH